MNKRRPPDILRKSHAHTEGNLRARERQSLRDELAATVSNSDAAILIKLDGVIYQGDQAVDGAQEAIDWLREHAIAYLFVADTTSQPPSTTIAAKLAHLDLPSAPEDIMTSSLAAAVERLQVPASQVWMIGDDIRTDIESAQRAGLKGILVKTGKFTQSDLALGIAPDLVLDSIADLPASWPELLHRHQ